MLLFDLNVCNSECFNFFLFSFCEIKTKSNVLRRVYSLDSVVHKMLSLLNSLSLAPALHMLIKFGERISCFSPYISTVFRTSFQRLLSQLSIRGTVGDELDARLAESLKMLFMACFKGLK